MVRNGANLEMDKSKLEILKLSEASSLYLDILRVLLSQCVLLGHAFSFFGLFSFLGPLGFPWIQSIAVLIAYKTEFEYRSLAAFLKSKLYSVP